MDPHLRQQIQGVAAMAITACEMGGCSDDDVFVTIVDHMTRLGILTRENALLLAEAIRTVPQPEDQDADERQRRRPVEEMVGLTSPERQLAAALRAHDQALRVAAHIVEAPG